MNLSVESPELPEAFLYQYIIVSYSEIQHYGMGKVGNNKTSELWVLSNSLNQQILITYTTMAMNDLHAVHSSKYPFNNTSIS